MKDEIFHYGKIIITGSLFGDMHWGFQISVTSTRQTQNRELGVARKDGSFKKARVVSLREIVNSSYQ